MGLAREDSSREGDATTNTIPSNNDMATMIDITEQHADNSKFKFELKKPSKENAHNIIVTSIKSFEQENLDRERLQAVR